MKRIIILLLLFSVFDLYSQLQKTIGGSGSDYLMDIVKCSDGYYLVGTSSSGISGDKTLPSFGNFDGWIVKVSDFFTIKTQYEFGGDDEDRLTSFVRSGDKYFIGLYSKSDTSGNKTTASYGNFDYWVVITDTNLNIEKQLEFGGDSADIIMKILPVDENKILLCGYSKSLEGSGNKTAENFGAEDFWLIMIDTSGNIIWQKTYGGTNSDKLTDAVLHNNRIYVIGTTESDSSGNKTSHLIGASDIWILCLDTSGNIIYDKTYGGTRDEIGPSIAVTDNYVYIGASSYSDSSGTKTENRIGIINYWCLKTDHAGNYIDDETIGGGRSDVLSKITSNGDVLVVAGYSSSSICCDKTINNIEYTSDYWVLTLDPSDFRILSQIVFGGDYTDISKNINLSSKVIVAGYSNSQMGYYKTESCRGGYDYWPVLFPEIEISGDIKPDNTKIYPNPVKNKIYISATNQIDQIKLFDNNMQEIMSKTINAENGEFDTSKLPAGMYILQIYLNNGTIFSKKITKIR